jgi:hypothetical protein
MAASTALRRAVGRGAAAVFRTYQYTVFDRLQSQTPVNHPPRRPPVRISNRFNPIFPKTFIAQRPVLSQK